MCFVCRFIRIANVAAVEYGVWGLLATGWREERLVIGVTDQTFVFIGKFSKNRHFSLSANEKQVSI